MPDTYALSPQLSALAELADPEDAEQDLTKVADFYHPSAWVDRCVRWRGRQGLAPYQREMLDAIPGNKRVAVRGPHGLGKTGGAALAILWFSCTRDLAGVDWKVPTTASVWRQLIRYLWPEVHKWARMLNWDEVGRPPFTRHELQVLGIKLRTGEAFALASDDPTSIEGAHADHLMYVFDEAKAISDATFDSAEGAFSTAGEGGTEAYALAISTPGEPIGRFYAIHARQPGTEEWWARHVRTEELQAAGRISEEFIESKARLWGKESAVFKNRVLGEFASSDEDGVIPLAWVELANERWVSIFGEYPAGFDSTDGTRRVIEADDPVTGLGVDVARGGQDRTVFALALGHVIAELRRYPASNDTMATADEVASLQLAHGMPRATIDTIGIGAGVYDRLKQKKHNAVGFTASEGTTKLDKSGEFGFTNKRSAAWWNVREMLDPSSGLEVALPPDDRLTGDLVAPRWRPMAGSRIQVESKDDIRKRIQRSTDDGDAVVMVLWEEPPGQGEAFLEFWRRRLGRNGNGHEPEDEPMEVSVNGHAGHIVYQ